MVSGAYGSYGGRPVDRKLRPRNLSKDGFEQMKQESQQFFPGTAVGSQMFPLNSKRSEVPQG